MRKRISASALGFLMLLSYGLDLLAQGTSRLVVRVTVVPVVTATPLRPPQVTAEPRQDAQLTWDRAQQSRVITRNANAAELADTWSNSSNPCRPEGTKVLYGSSNAGPCEITLNTVEFVPE